jgi:hypothetical protein
MLKEYHRTAKTQGIFSFFIFFIFTDSPELARYLNDECCKLLICKGLRHAAGRAAVSR